MADHVTDLSRRDFFRTTAAGGFAIGGMLGLGFNLQAAQDEVRKLRIADAREVPSVCPYCAVGCGQLVSVSLRDKKIINIEGNPASPISRGTLCPKGAATFQLAVNPNRITEVWHREPRATEWTTKSLSWAMKRIAELVQKTRDKPGNFIEKMGPDAGPLAGKVVNHTLAIASLGGATMDNEWNYVQAKLMRALGVVNIENQARI
jgi:formate dehydrogenase major subunit